MSGAVLVGVDGSAASLAAVDLALREAALRSRPVHVVYADPWAHHAGWAEIDPDATLTEELLADPQLVLRTALKHAAATGTGTTPVGGEVLAGDPASILIGASARAELVVLGHRGRGGFAELLVGSVAAKVAAHAVCPVLVTRGAPPREGDVLVGVDDSFTPSPALDFAFREAALRGVGLVAVHAWTGPYLSGPSDLLVYDPELARQELERLLAEAVAGSRNGYQAVPVSTRLLWGRATRTLVGACQGAQLAVLGPRGAGGLPGLRLGSVTHALLHHAPCPVAVVPAA
jgi:nucleotide-binding universal stress UspA family protein